MFVVSERKPWDSNPQAPSRSPPVFETGSSSGRMTSVRCHTISSGGWNRTNELLIQSQASLPTATAPERTKCEARGEGIEPSSPGSKPGGLPLTDPRMRCDEVPCGNRTRLSGVEDRCLSRSAKGTQSGRRGSRTLKASIARPFSRRLPSPIGLPFQRTKLRRQESNLRKDV